MVHQDTIDKTFVEFINAIPKPLPTSVVSIEDALGMRLRVVSQDKNTASYEAKGFTTSDGYTVKFIDVRVSGSAPSMNIGPFLLVEVDTDNCIPVEVIGPALGLTHMGDPSPDDPSLFDMFSPVTWGSYAMTVRTKLGGRRCVDAVIIKNNPIYAPPPPSIKFT